MRAFICRTCGTQFAPSEVTPSECLICCYERQYIGPGGQTWTTLDEMRRSHFSKWRQHEPGLIGLGTSPDFAIGQRALLVRTDAGLVMWDCISFIDEAAAELVRALGGLRAIAISHPHYYGSMIEWSRAFGDAPVFLHAADRQWVMRPDPAIRFWEGETLEIAPGLSLIHCGGHFEGATILHWAQGAGGKGAVLSGDVLQVGPDRKLSFMRSYPNLIPLDRSSVQRIADVLDPWRFEAIYGAWFETVIPSGGKRVVAESVQRYLRAISAPPR